MSLSSFTSKLASCFFSFDLVTTLQFPIANGSSLYQGKVDFPKGHHDIMKACVQLERTISTHPYHARKSLTAGTRGEPGPWEGLFPFTGGPQRHLPGGPGYPLSPLSPITSCPRKQRKQQTAVLLASNKSGDGSGLCKAEK